MAATTCYGCALPIMADQVCCTYCPKMFHPSCTLSAMQEGSSIVCNYGCRQAYEAGIAAAHRKRAMHVCTECGKSFSKSSNLHTHVRTVHLKQKHGPCPCCNKWFASKQSWRQHLNTQRSKTLILLEKDEAAPCSPHLSLRMPRSHQPTTCIAPAPPRAYTKPETSPSGSSKPSLGLALAACTPTYHVRLAAAAEILFAAAAICAATAAA